MRKKYTNQQILEAIECLKSQLDESESLFSHRDGFAVCSARDLIIKNVEDVLGSDVNIREIFLSQWISMESLPFKLNDDDRQKIKKICENPFSRVIACYVYPGTSDKWTDAAGEIESRYDFENYIDPESEWNNDYGFDEQFAKTFKTYDEWKNHLAEQAVVSLKRCLQTSEFPYSSLVDDVKVNQDGVAYVIIVWRA